MSEKYPYQFITQIICKHIDGNMNCNLFSRPTDKEEDEEQHETKTKTFRLAGYYYPHTEIMEQFIISSMNVNRDIRGNPMETISFEKPVKCKITDKNDILVLKCRIMHPTEEEGLIVLD